MSDETPQSSSSSPPPHIRRSSFAGQTFADLFGTSRPSLNRNPSESPSSSPTQQMPGPISQAAAQAQRRRLSLTTLGLSGSPNQPSPFTGIRPRGDSIGSATSGSIDESAVAEDDANFPPRDSNLSSSSPSSTPFQRRTSFGAKALRDIRGASFSGPSGGGGGAGQQQNQNGNGTSPPNGTAAMSNGSGSSNGNKAAGAAAQNGTISARDGNAKGRAPSEGFNWSDNFRTRAERTSIAGQGMLSGGFAAQNQSRTKSVATMEPPPVAPPKPKEKPRPDHFQERILKGDFYMD